MSELRILNLGAGVQSTRLYLMAAYGEIEPYDYAITADTQDEYGSVERKRGMPDPVAQWDAPGETSFYYHLEWLGSHAAYLDSQSPLVRSSNLGGAGCPILVRTAGCISDDLTRGENSTGQRFATIPAYTSAIEGSDEGQTRRQCTKEYKVEVIERAIRRELLGLAPGARVPKDVIVRQFIGVSWEERSRAFDIARRFMIQDSDEEYQLDLWGGETIISVHTGQREKPNWRVNFQLIEDGRQITRADCTTHLRRVVPHKVSGSACIECPYKDDPTWAAHMLPSPTRDRLVQIDLAIRTPGMVINRGLAQKLYLHRSCRPITEIDFGNKRQNGFQFECEGGCGL